MDVEQYHFLQRDAVSSFHERLSKGDKIVCDLLDTLEIWIGLTITLGTCSHPVRRRCKGKERRIQCQDESTEVPQE